MVASTPEQVHALFTDAFTKGNLDALVALYEDAAVLLAQPGHPVTGKAAIRDALAGFLGLNGTFSMKHPAMLRSGEIAILYASWSLHAKDADGAEIILSGRTSDVVRQQKDGSWRYVIDNPYGGDGFTD